MLQPHAIVVNTGRGSTVDDAALIEALRTGRVLAAGLDVFNNEPELILAIMRSGECGAAPAYWQRDGGDARCDGFSGPWMGLPKH